MISQIKLITNKTNLLAKSLAYNISHSIIELTNKFLSNTYVSSNHYPLLSSNSGILSILNGLLYTNVCPSYVFNLNYSILICNGSQYYLIAPPFKTIFNVTDYVKFNLNDKFETANLRAYDFNTLLEMFSPPRLASYYQSNPVEILPYSSELGRSLVSDFMYSLHVYMTSKIELQDIDWIATWSEVFEGADLVIAEDEIFPVLKYMLTMAELG